MENNWPETIDELLDECQRLISKYDLYTLGERGAAFPGETEPRVDGTEYLAGEYQYGVAMIPAQWIRHALSNATLGSEREAKLIRAMEDVLRYATDTVWVSEIETLVDRMVSLGVYGCEVYEGARPWEVDA